MLKSCPFCGYQSGEIKAFGLVYCENCAYGVPFELWQNRAEKNIQPKWPEKAVFGNIDQALGYNQAIDACIKAWKETNEEDL